MSETKSFPTAAVLSAITGRLVSEIGAVYEVLNWMTGESLFTHQLPRVGREAAPVLIAKHPELQLAIAESSAVTPDNYQEWLAIWLERYGPEIEVPLMDESQHEQIDPLSELAEKAHPDRIIIL